MSEIAAPFPRFGGKRPIAARVWERFGKVQNYVEPFFGTGAVLFARPDVDGSEIETVNDRDCYLANFWRAVQAEPDAVAEWADSPINEADLHAWHRWLVQRAEFRERMLSDPEFYDVKVAGRWVWGACGWIGSGWCDTSRVSQARQLPHLSTYGMGIHRKLPHLGNAGMGYVFELFRALRARLRRVRVACGDWSRVTGESVTFRHGLTAVFLDPPYSEGADDLYSDHDKSLSATVREWAIENGGNPKMRIALCGYDGEHEMPPSWRVMKWRARGGYGSQREDGTNENAGRERAWFSPHCLDSADAGPLFANIGCAP